MDKVKVTVIALVSALMSSLGILAVPVLLMVGCSVIDYITGLIAANWRKEKINSYKSIRGIVKKIMMWTLVIIGSWIDMLVDYSVKYIRPDMSWPFVVAIVVAVWIVINEIISILENMNDCGVRIPPFLLPLAKRIQTKVEESASVEDENEDERKGAISDKEI